MRIKPGVVLDGMHPVLWVAVGYYDYLRQIYGLGEGTITGGREAPDAGPASAARRSGTDAHARGEAADLRVNDIPQMALALAQALQDALGADFRVVVEVDHIHLALIAP